MLLISGYNRGGRLVGGGGRVVVTTQSQSQTQRHPLKRNYSANALKSYANLQAKVKLPGKTWKMWKTADCAHTEIGRTFLSAVQS